MEEEKKENQEKEAGLTERQFFPITASVNVDPKEDTREQLIEMFRQTDELPIALRYGMINQKVSNNIKELSKKYKIEDLKQIGSISRMIRDVYVKKISGKDVSVRIGKELNLEGKALEEFTNELKKTVLLVKKTGEKEFGKAFEKLPIIPALNKYKKLKDQEITAGEIIVSGQEEEEIKEPTVKNWIENYVKEKGAQAHSNIERSTYLFDSLNAKELSGEERWIVAEILESYDEDKALLIYKESEEVYFEKPGILEGVKEKIIREEEQSSQTKQEVKAVSEKIPEEKQAQVSEISMANRRPLESPVIAREGIEKAELQQETNLQTEAKKKEAFMIKRDSLVIESAQKADYEKLQEKLSGEEGGNNEVEKLPEKLEKTKAEKEEVNQKNIVDLRNSSQKK